jgi:BlaI family transcriptional regulator, penicillinase repressor
MSFNLRGLSRRERQIMEIIYAKGEATAAEIGDSMPDAPSNSAIRTLLRILEEKGMLRHREEGPRFVFQPVESREKASRSALKQVVQTFFDGSLASAVAAFVETKDAKLSRDEMARIEAIIKKAKVRRA